MKKVAVSLLLSLAFLLYACKEGPAGAAGPPGKDGKDGIDAGFVYFDGFLPNLQCSKCHTPGIDTTFYVAGRKVEWANSKHVYGGDVDRNANNCAGCHTTEGFLDRTLSNPPFVTQFANSSKLHPSPPGCFACHAPHGRGNFTFRDTSAITVTNVFAGGTNVAFDGGGKSNLCVKCHQPRNVSAVTPAPNVNATAVTDTLTIATTRWYQHYGVQPQMFLGTGGNGGFQFTGYTYSNSGHTTLIQSKALGCIDCHMQEPVGGGAAKAGGHTMKLKYEAEGVETFLVYDCRKCHTDITSNSLTKTAFDAYKSGARSTIEAKLDTLATLLGDTLITSKWTGGTRRVAGKTVPWLSKTVSAEGVSYSILAGSVSGVTYPSIKAVPSAKAGALWNFMFIEHDMSEGVHNYQYAKALLDASIAELKK